MIIKPPKILTLKSSISELKNVEKFVNEIFEINNIPRKYFNNVLLCISEAVINSIEHGNKNDPKKKVSIFADCESESIIVHVKDEGEGFNLDKIPDPTSVKNLKKVSGRGIHIIKALSEQIDYCKKTNSIQFKIKCK